MSSESKTEGVRRKKNKKGERSVIVGRQSANSNICRPLAEAPELWGACNWLQGEVLSQCTLCDYLKHISGSLDNKTEGRQASAIFFPQMLCSFSKVLDVTVHGVPRARWLPPSKLGKSQVCSTIAPRYQERSAPSLRSTNCLGDQTTHGAKAQTISGKVPPQSLSH